MRHVGLVAAFTVFALAGSLEGCAQYVQVEPVSFDTEVSDSPMSPEEIARYEAERAAFDAEMERQARICDTLAALDMNEDYRESFDHGIKEGSHQRYIVLHDTEGDGNASSVIDYWDRQGSGVAAHFVVNKDGSIMQCVPLDRIAHHAGFGDTGNNERYGVEDESRDDKVGTVPIGDWASDYGMNSYSIGIELVHVGGSGDYPSSQLRALDGLIAYIDAYYGFESEIIDHKAWRSGNSDTSAEFATYLENYRLSRNHSGEYGSAEGG